MTARLLHIQVACTEALDDVVRAAIVRLCIEAHNEQSFANLFVYVPAGGLHVIATFNGEVVGHAMATTRWAQPEDLPVLQTAYIDAVSTLPRLQGQGVGSRVMAELVRQLGDYEIACLETDRPGFYERLGWQIWRGPKAGRSVTGLIPTPATQIVMVYHLPQTPLLNLDGLLTIETQGARIW